MNYSRAVPMSLPVQDLHLVDKIGMTHRTVWDRASKTLVQLNSIYLRGFQPFKFKLLGI